MSTDSLLVELGTEELPPKALKSLGLALRDGIMAGLEHRALAYGEVTWFATPRRLAVHIRDVQQCAPEKTVETLGPPLERARDEAGNWTPAANGFAKKQGLRPDQLAVLDTPKGQRLGLRSTVPGASVEQDLSRIVQDSIEGLPIPRRMRWGASREDVHFLGIASDCLSGSAVLLRYVSTAPTHIRAFC